jgi:putative membrane protein
MASPYTKFSEEELILRDQLAIDRTILANESTFLAYIRTSLAIIAGGATLIHFFEEILSQYIGWMLVAFGLVILIMGYKRFKRMERTINEIKRI